MATDLFSSYDGPGDMMMDPHPIYGRATSNVPNQQNQVLYMTFNQD